MTKPDHLKALQSTKDALVKISKELKPFVQNLESEDADKKAQAQAVVALSIGTLRYMGARLQGKDEGRSKDDPLRQELDQMRQTLVKVEKKRKRDDAGDNTKKDETKQVSSKPGESKTSEKSTKSDKPKASKSEVQKASQASKESPKKKRKR